MTPEYAVLTTNAIEEHGFKVAVKDPICEVETLYEAQVVCLRNDGGGAIFKLRQPLGLPEVAGGHQPFGELINIKDLKWMCAQAIIFPGTIGEQVVIEEIVKNQGILVREVEAQAKLDEKGKRS